MKTQTIFILALILLTTSLVSAYPGIPHQFYGDVSVNGQSAPDNNVLVASIEGDEYITVTKDGEYGYAPNIFYIKDPNGDRAGKTIDFYLGGKNVGSFTFENNGFTKFDISTTTNCGDGYCLGDETCSSCSSDCGICTDPPIITIVSPEQDAVYNNVKVNLDVMADQEIIVWMYALNDLDPITFTPSITLTLEERSYELTVIGLSKENYLSGSRTVSFSIELPVASCGDGSCNNGETCSSCPADCGACPVTPPSGGGGNGGSPSGGGGSPSGGGSVTLLSTTTTDTPTSDGEEGNLDLISSDETRETTGSRITGGVIGFVKSGKGIVVFVSFLLVIFIAFIAVKKFKKERLRKKD